MNPNHDAIVTAAHDALSTIHGHNLEPGDSLSAATIALGSLIYGTHMAFGTDPQELLLASYAVIKALCGIRDNA